MEKRTRIVRAMMCVAWASTAPAAAQVPGLSLNPDALRAPGMPLDAVEVQQGDSECNFIEIGRAHV